jgi:hypothetical protein
VLMWGLLVTLQRIRGCNAVFGVIRYWDKR